MSNNQDTFEEIFYQNEREVFYHMHKLGIQDPHREFYMEGIYAMWMAYKKYNPNKGSMSTYFNYTIRNHLIDKIRKETREQQYVEKFIQQEKTKLVDGNHDKKNKMPIMNSTGITIKDDNLWGELRSRLTKRQMKYVYYHLIIGYSLAEIAEREGVSIEAVKSWGKEAKKKLRKGMSSLLR